MRSVRHMVRQSTFNENGTLTLLLAAGYVDDGGAFVQLTTASHDIPQDGLASFFGDTPDASGPRILDLMAATNKCLMEEGVIFEELFAMPIAIPARST